jgi:pimeloyl-ACP methyl ester carboxylesterase
MLYVHESGSRTAPAIVFLHGAGLSGCMWQPQFTRLPDYYCLAPDLPEQGRSTEIGPLQLEDTALEVAALIRERVPSGRAHVVGLSLGGAVALTLLRVVPECVDYILVSGTSTRLGPMLSALSYASGYVYPYVPSEILLSALLKQNGIPEAYRDQFRDDVRLTTNPTFVEHYTHALRSLELPREATSPLLVVTGAHETLVAQHVARTLVRSIKGAYSLVVPGVGHAWNLQVPDLFTDILRAWISDDPLAQTWLPLQCEMV